MATSHDSVSEAQRRLLEAAAAVSMRLTDPAAQHNAVLSFGAQALAASEQMFEAELFELGVMVQECGRLVIASYRERSNVDEVV